MVDFGKWDPWQDLERLRSRMNEMLDEFCSRLPAPSEGRRIEFTPRADVLETEELYIIRVALPGVLEEDIDVLVEESSITVRGEAEEPPAPVGTKKIIHREWRYGYFERIFRFPADIDPSRVEATLENGVLEIRVAK